MIYSYVKLIYELISRIITLHNNLQFTLYTCLYLDILQCTRWTYVYYVTSYIIDIHI